MYFFSLPQPSPVAIAARSSKNVLAEFDSASGRAIVQDATVRTEFQQDLLNLIECNTTLALVHREASRVVPVMVQAEKQVPALELARALACEPTLLLADEPSSGLDRHEAEALADVLRTVQQRRSMAVLLVEHDLDMVARATDRVVVLDVGTVIAEGPFDDVVATPAVRRAYLGAAI